MKIQGILVVLALAGVVPVAMAQSGTSADSSLTYTQPLSMPAVRSVQQSLHELGLYQGNIDGNWGSGSASALEQFQQTHGLQVTGQLNEATAKTLNLNLAKLLGVQQPAGASATSGDGQNAAQNGSETKGQASGTKGSTLSRDAIRTVQHRLRELNFEVGPADGIWGADTQKALMQFQQGHALQPTGQLNPATINALGLNSDRLLLQNNQQ